MECENDIERRQQRERERYRRMDRRMERRMERRRETERGEKEREERGRERIALSLIAMVHFLLSQFIFTIQSERSIRREKKIQPSSITAKKRND